MRSPVGVVLIFLVTSLAGAQDWAKAKLMASPRHQEWATVQNGARSVKCFIVYPEVAKKAPVVLVVHEIFGESDWIMDLADQLAAHGYITVVPDLLSGMGPNGGRTDAFGGDQEKIVEAVSNLPEDQVMGDLNAAADYALKLPGASGKLFVSGFCWGGGQAFKFATVRADLSAAFVFYGLPPDAAAMAKITAPVYGFYAGNDNRVSSTVPETEKEMKAAGKQYQAKIYPGAGHGFMRAGEEPNAQPGNKKAHDEACKRWLNELKKR